MDDLTIYFRNTILTMIIATLVIGIIVYWTNKQREKRTEKTDKILRLKFGRILTFGLTFLFYFLLFIHFGLFALTGLINDDLPGLSLNLNFASICGFIFTTVFLTSLFIISVPNLIVFCQFLKLETGRTIILIEEERTIEVFTEGHKITIKNSDIDNLEFHLKKTFGRADESLDYVKITTKENNTIIITDLLTPVDGFSAINSVFKGAKRKYIAKYYNKIKYG